MCCDAFRKPEVQNRLIRFSLFLTLVGLIVHIVSMSATSWYKIEAGPHGRALKVQIQRLYANVWQVDNSCLVRSKQNSKLYEDIPCNFFRNISPEDVDKYRDYTRTIKAFSILSLVIGVVAFATSVYCVFFNRYVLKRLAGALLGLTAMCEIVQLNVFSGWITLGTGTIWKPYLPNKDTGYYAYGYYIAWFTFGCFVLAATTMFFASRKQVQQVYYGSTRQPRLDEDAAINLK